MLAALAFSCQKEDLACTDCNESKIAISARNHNSEDATDLYISTNTGGSIGIVDVSDINNVGERFIDVVNTDGDGIFYDQPSNVMYQVDRSNNRVNAYAATTTLPNGAAVSPSMMSTSDFNNGREMAVKGNFIVVAEDAAPGNGNMNRFYVYQNTGSSISLVKTFNATINLWGLTFVGNNLYAVEDNSSNLAIYNNFLSNSDGSTLTPSVKLTISGIVRTHGIDYNAENDVLTLTDVGDAGSSTDGAIHVITNFTSSKLGFAMRTARYSGGAFTATIPMSQQVRLSGSNTFLGNPVDVDYNYETGEIFVAERANGGGRVLAFNFPSGSGNPSPIYNQTFAGASAVHLNVYNVY